VSATDEQLLVAVKHGDPSAVRDALDAGANPNTSHEGGHSALIDAVELGHVDVVVELLRGGADVNWATGIGWTALHNAIDVEADAYTQGHGGRDLRVIEILLDAGANVNAPWSGSQGIETPIDVARTYGWQEAVDVLTSRAH
jgi:ankyrin repeat protein